MSITRHERAAEVFEAALFADDPIEHARSLCGDDVALFDEVCTLLSARTRAAGFLQTSPMSVREAPLEPGTAFAGYDIVRRLASGGGGTVYEATQANPRRSVALKILRRHTAGDEDRFVREAQFLAQLRHPHIAHVYEAGVFDERPYVVVELAVGAHDLLAYAESHKLSIQQRLALFARTCDAVQFAHQKGVAHCDLKPANMLIDQAGHPKLIDFGIARLVGEGDKVRAGTPPYMSPEQKDAGEADARSDVYALGIVLRELTGVSAGRDVSAIIARATAHAPEQRYASASALADDVRRFLEHRPLEARESNALYHVTCFAKRHTLAFGLLTALVAVSTAAALVSTWLAIDRDHERTVANQQRDRAALQSYVASMSAAEAALRTFDVGAARLHLTQAPTEHRDWEWRHLWGRLDASEATWHAPVSLEHGAISPDGRYAVGASARAFVFDLQRPGTGQEIPTVHGLTAAGYSSDSQWLAVGDSRGGVAVVSHDGREIRHTWAAHDAQVWALSWLADDKRFLTAGYDGHIHLWSPDGKRLRTWSTPNTRPFSIAVHAETIWCGAQDGHVFAFDLTGSKPTRRFALHKLSVEGIAISPDGTRLVTGSMDRTVCAWDAQSLALQWRVRTHRSGVKGVCIDARGAQVLSCSVDRTACLWELWDGTLQARFTGHADFVRSVAFDRQGARVLTFSRDKTIKAWSADATTSVPTLKGHEDEVYGLSWLPDGQVVSATATGVLRWWDPMRLTANRRAAYDWAPYYQPLSIAGSHLAARQRNGRIGVWSLQSGERITQLPRGDAQAVSADGSTVFLGGTTLTRYRLASGTHDAQHTFPLVQTVFASHAGDHAAVASGSHLYLWTPASDRAPFPLPLAKVTAASFSTDGRWVAVAHKKDVSLIDLHTQPPTITSTLRGHTGVVRAVAWAPGDRRLATAALDGTVRLWDPAQRVQVLVLHGHQEYATALVWSPDGKTLISGGGNSGDGACQLFVWRTP